MDVQMWHILMLLALICLGLELFVGTFVLLSFAIALGVIAIANVKYDVDSVANLSLLFAVSAVISGYILRRWLGPKISRRSDVNEY